MTQTKELSIVMVDGAKKMEFKTNDFNEDYQLAVMNGLFKFFDIDVDFAQMIEVYHKTGKSYQEFYGDKEEPALTEVNEPKPLKEKDAEFTKQYAAAIQDEAPVFTNTKIKNGVTTYKCHYICPRCRNRANTYIDKHEVAINCRDCEKLMPVSTATEEGNLTQDRFGNFFIAGDFRRSNYTPLTNE